MLDAGALATLPIQPNSFPSHGMLRPLFDTVVSALKTEKLLPSHRQGFRSGQECRFARGEGLRELLDPQQLAVLMGDSNDLHWISDEITQNKTSALHEFLVKQVGIVEITPDSLVSRLSAEFFGQQPDEWFKRFYNFLSGQKAMLRELLKRGTPFIRRDDDSLVPPKLGELPQAFLPSGGVTGFRTVKPTICDSESVMEFLRSLGLSTPDPVDDVIQNVLCHYTNINGSRSETETLDAVTNTAWCETWQASKKGAVKARSHMKYEQVTRDWLKFLNGRADKPLEAVTRADVIAYRDRLVSAGLAARTANQTVKLLRGIYAEAVERGHLGRNPFAGVDSLREMTEDVRRIPFSNADVAALIKEADDDWEGMVILAATTGLRLMDAARLKWNNLDLKAKLIRVKTAKTGAKLELPIHPRFSTWLKSQTQGIGAAPVFPSLANKGGPGKSGLSMAFKRLMERAGISAGVARKAKEKSRGRTTSQKSFHSLRHFAATQLAAAGVRAEVARQITGHADAEMHGNYVNADLDVLRGAVESIELTA